VNDGVTLFEADREGIFADVRKPLPTISIITAALNAQFTIEDCLASVKNQLEASQHIIVDGGSTDNTLAIAKKYSRSNDVIISGPDRGMYDALNKGLAQADGEIIGVLNADDFYPHSCILSLIAHQFRDGELDACYGDLVCVSRSDIANINRYWVSRPYNGKLFARGWMPPHPTFFCRRSLYEQYGGFRLDMGTAADYELLLRFFVKYHIRTLYIPHILVVMRAGGMSNVSIKNRLAAAFLIRQAWHINGIKPRPWISAAKSISRIPQFIARRVYNKPWLDEDWPCRDQHDRITFDNPTNPP
jgi:glycosyltransferase involved in cell wall biosynthesis